MRCTLFIVFAEDLPSSFPTPFLFALLDDPDGMGEDLSPSLTSVLKYSRPAPFELCACFARFSFSTAEENDDDDDEKASDVMHFHLLTLSLLLSFSRH
jgi:hypothetical protein